MAGELRLLSEAQCVTRMGTLSEDACLRQVFQSSMHMGRTYFPYCSLHRQTPEDLLRYTLDQGTEMLHAYCRDRLLIPQGKVGFDLHPYEARCCYKRSHLSIIVV